MNVEAPPEKDAAGCEVSVSRPTPDMLLVKLVGSWKIDGPSPSIGEIQGELEAEPRVSEITFDSQALREWDSSLLAFLIKVIRESSQRDIRVTRKGLPIGVQRLLKLALAVPEKKGPLSETEPFLSRIGSYGLTFVQSAADMLDFLGEAAVAFTRMLAGKARFQRSDLVSIIQTTGAEALPIVTLISVLVGLILAFVGAVQLKMFGAQIYVADLVGIAMVRVMGAIMTGIIMAGRTGAAFAAELGTMQVNEEIDALRTLGISPMEFLVLPRMLALTLMMPLLCLYADLMGVIGGLIVGVTMLDISPMEYYTQTRAAIDLSHLWVGLFHSFVFGILVALSGCLRGMQCGRSASAVGDATTSAVVTGIVSIIISTAVITVVCDILGI
jgi:phospholipid/cholesterol/gamma-HCH transport system permease protein